MITKNENFVTKRSVMDVVYWAIDPLKYNFLLLLGLVVPNYNVFHFNMRNLTPPQSYRKTTLKEKKQTR